MDKLELILENLRQKDVFEIEKAQQHIEQVHAGLPRLLDRLEQCTGITSDALVKYSVQTTFLHANFKWYEVLFILDTFYTQKMIGERSERKNEQHQSNTV